jgi:hypothetical protein
MKSWIRLFLVILTAEGIRAAPFLNLDFDEPRINEISLSYSDGYWAVGDPTSLLPGWDVLLGDEPVTKMYLNHLNGPLTDQPPGPNLVSQYSRDFLGGPYYLQILDSIDASVQYSIAQRGDVPNDAAFMSYRVDGLGFDLTVDGVGLDPIHVQEDTLFSWDSVYYDVSAFAGRNVELRFTATSRTPFFSEPHAIDGITFLSIPEPGTMLLAFLAIFVPLGLYSIRAVSGLRRKGPVWFESSPSSSSFNGSG